MNQDSANEYAGKLAALQDAYIECVMHGMDGEFIEDNHAARDPLVDLMVMQRIRLEAVANEDLDVRAALLATLADEVRFEINDEQTRLRLDAEVGELLERTDALSAVQDAEEQKVEQAVDLLQQIRRLASKYTTLTWRSLEDDLDVALSLNLARAFSKAAVSHRGEGEVFDARALLVKMISSGAVPPRKMDQERTIEANRLRDEFIEGLKG